MKSLQDLDDLVRYCEEFPYPDMLKLVQNLRAQFVLDIAKLLPKPMYPPPPSSTWAEFPS